MMKRLMALALGVAVLAGSAAGAMADEARLHESAGEAAAPRLATGKVAWSQSVDESGAAVLEAHVDVPERGLSADITIKANHEAGLPASHLVEISFTPGAAFGNEAVDSVPGLLAKAEPDVQGTALSGATVNVTNNVFLFGLSNAPEAVARNLELLGSERWLDIAMVYKTGERAILTLEKDEAAAKVFDAVMAAWQMPAAR